MNLSRANSLSEYGPLLAKLMRGGYLSHANLVRSAGGCFIAFWILPSPEAAALLPDDGYEDALNRVVTCEGSLSARSLRTPRTLHKRVMRELARAGLCTKPGRGYSAVWTSTIDERRAWLNARSRHP